MYIYGYPEFDLAIGEDGFDDATMNMILIGLGTMAGVGCAGQLMNTVTKMLAKGVEQQLLKIALTKTVAFKVAKSVLKWFGIKLAKDAAAKLAGNALVALGGAIIGGMTLITFSKSCEHFRKEMEINPFNDPTRYADIIETDFDTIEEIEAELEKAIQVDDVGDDELVSII